MKKLLTYTLPLTISACINFSDVETQALFDRAVADAKKQPKAIHLAYLHCYPLDDVYKDSCKRAIRYTIAGSKDASSWEYIRPFDYEAERLGFATFLRDRGKTCKAINEGPKYNREKDAYNVHCEGGKNYSMRFDSETGNWSIVD